MHVQIVNLRIKAVGEEDYGKQCETKAFALANLPRTPAYPSGRFGYLARLRMLAVHFGPPQHTILLCSIVALLRHVHNLADGSPISAGHGNAK